MIVVLTPLKTRTQDIIKASKLVGCVALSNKLTNKYAGRLFFLACNQIIDNE